MNTTCQGTERPDSIDTSLAKENHRERIRILLHRKELSRHWQEGIEKSSDQDSDFEIPRIQPINTLSAFLHNHYEAANSSESHYPKSPMSKSRFGSTPFTCETIKSRVGSISTNTFVRNSVTLGA
jgi:hypothetical protein